MWWTVRVLMLIVSLGVVALGCGVDQEKYDADMAALQAEINRTQGELTDAQQRLAALQTEKQALEGRLAKLDSEMARLESEAAKRAKELERARKREEVFRNMINKFQAMVKSGKLKIKIVNNKMVVEMASAILFPSGRAKLSEEGKDALAEVAMVLATIPDRNFQVAGHTDNVPIRKQRFKSNWALSAARAVAVVEHMVENGMSAPNLSAAGYADTQPSASNDTEEGKAQNRRIEITLQPNLDELPDLSALENML